MTPIPARETISDRYQLSSLIGEGGQYRAYLARDHLLDQTVVIKELAADIDWEAARREFELLSRLRHPNIVGVSDLVGTPRGLFLVQSYAAGPDFRGWAAEHPSAAEICEAGAAVVRGLQYLHQNGIVHRDVKPENIRVGAGRIGRLPAARLLDFGLATDRPAAEPSGTLGYMAPEVMSGEPASPASDFYSLGVTLHEALEGRPPRVLGAALTAAPPRELLREATLIPEDLARGHVLAETLFDLLSPQASHRPTADALLEALSLVAGAPLELQPEELAGEYFPWPRLVGRGEATALLDRFIREAKSGATRWVQITGHGKTAFCSAAMARGQLSGLRGLELGSRDALLRLAPLAEENLPPQRLATLVVNTLEEQRRIGSLLLLLDGLDPRDPLVAAVLREISFVLGAPSSHGCLVLWTGDLPDGKAGAFTPVHLPDLTAGEVREMVQSMLCHLPQLPWLDEVHPATGGDPRLVVELVRRQIEGGLPRDLLPLGDLDSSAVERVSRLQLGQRELLAALAHAPCPVSPGVLAVVAPDHMPELGSLLARGLLVASQDGVSPGNAALRAAGQAQIQGPALEDLHRRFARAWSGEAALPEVLAHHLLRAGEIEEAAIRLLEAKVATETEVELVARRLPAVSPSLPAILAKLARLQRARGDLEAALSLATRVGTLDLAAGDLLSAELLLDAGQPLRAVHLLDPLPTQTSEARLMRARCAVLLGDFRQAGESARAALEMAGVTPEQRGQILNVLGLSLSYQGQPEEGLRILRRAEENARQSVRPETLARVLNSRGIALQRLGQLAEAAAAYEECLVLFERLGDLRLAATTALNLGTLAQSRLDLAGALSFYRRASLLGERGDLGSTRAWSQANEGNLLLLFGALAEAEAKLTAARALALAEQARSLLGRISLYQAEACLARGSLEEAAALLGQAVDHFDASDLRGQTACLVLRAELLLEREEPEAARTAAQACLARVDQEDPDWLRGHLLLATIDLRVSSPTAGAVLEQLELALSSRGEDHPGERDWEVHAVLARGFAARGQADQAAQHLQAFRTALHDLRRRVPAQYRQAFDGRPDVRRALSEAARLGAETAATPPVQGMLRLLEINQELNQGLPLPQQLERILDGAIELARAERGFILLRQRGQFRVVASRNIDREPVRRGAAKFSRSIALQAIRQGKPVRVADASADDRFRETLSVAGLRLRAVLCVPLRVRGEVQGALYLDNRFSTELFDPGTVTLTQAFADQAGIAMENTRLLEEATAQREQLAEAKAKVEALNQKLMAQVERQSQELSEISVRLKHHEEELVRRYNAAQLIGRSKPMQELFAKMERLAGSEVPVVIYGESGTGKELVARAIHYTSARAEQPFVALNCGAVPGTLLESELFGCSRGAFTGADRDRPGVFEIAKAGTLLLDEIGDMPLEMQVKLLRVLQEGTFRRLGDDKERRSSCRILSASHQSLKELVASGGFREDLFYRLHVIQLDIPPLRERREDIPLLVRHFLAEEKGQEVAISPAALQALMDFGWPGNIRQLENELKRAALLCDAGIEISSLSPEIRGSAPTATAGEQGFGLKEAVREYERRLIESTLEDSRFNVSLAAQKLGIHRVVLHSKMRGLGITRPGRGRKV